jgi:hypothetical protein
MASRPLPLPWRAQAVVLSVAALTVLAVTMVLWSGLPAHQRVNRAAKADALESLADLKSKLGVRIAWDRFFHERRLADPRATSEFAVVAEAHDDGGLTLVAVKQKEAIAW